MSVVAVRLLELLTLQCRNVTTLKSTSSFDQEVEEESKFSFYILSVHWLCDGHHSTNGPFQWSETRGLLPLPVQCAKFNVWRRTIWEYQLQKQWNVAVKIRAISNLSELCLIFNTRNLCKSKYLQKLIYKTVLRIQDVLEEKRGNTYEVHTYRRCSLLLNSTLFPHGLCFHVLKVKEYYYFYYYIRGSNNNV